MTDVDHMEGSSFWYTSWMLISEPSQYNQCPFGDVGPRFKPRTQELDRHVQYRGPLEWPC